MLEIPTLKDFFTSEDKIFLFLSNMIKYLTKENENF